MSSPHSTSEPYDHGLLATGDGNLIYYELRGNPNGLPLVIVHGGPGTGSPTGTPRSFDPDRYHVILFDQRGCGRSVPTASDPATSMATNTTVHLLGDMERLREHLRVDRWLIFGGSWGSGLAVDYAERHPARVAGLVVVSVWTMSRPEIAWLYGGGVGQLFPDEYEQFEAAVPADLRTGDVVSDYVRLMGDQDESVRMSAASSWAAWEDTVVSLEPQGRSRPFSDRPAKELQAFVRICSTYAANAAWREDGALARDAHLLADVPGSIVHGRLDLSCPLRTARDLARAWPRASFVVADDAGHKGGPSMNLALREAFEQLDRP